MRNQVYSLESILFTTSEGRRNWIHDHLREDDSLSGGYRHQNFVKIDVESEGRHGAPKHLRTKLKEK